MLTLEFWIMFVPAVMAIALLMFVVVMLADKIERLTQRMDDLDRDDVFTGQMMWPIDDTDTILEALRDQAGDEDDTKRKQFESVMALTEKRH